MSVVLGLEDGSNGDVETDCDRTAGREKTDRTSSVQCEPVAKSVLVRQQGDATRVWQPNPAEVAEDELVSKARFCCSRQLVVAVLEAREHRVSQIAHMGQLRLQDATQCRVTTGRLV